MNNNNETPTNGAVDSPVFLHTTRSWSQLKDDFPLKEPVEEISSAFEVDELSVAACLLQVLGATHGASIGLQVAHTKITSPFNLVMVEEGGKSANWFVALGRHFAVTIQQRIGKFEKHLKEVRKCGIPAGMPSMALSKETQAHPQGTKGDYLGEVARRLAMGDGPIGSALVQRTLDPSQLEEAILKSPDGSVLVETPASGVVEAVSRLKEIERARLSDWLMESGGGETLSLSDASVRGNLCFRWLVPRTEVGVLMRMSQCAFTRIPALFFKGEGTSPNAYLNDVPASLNAVHRILDMVMAKRLRQGEKSAVYELKGLEALKVIEDFHDAAMAWESSKENPFKISVKWFADYALKMGLLRRVFGFSQEELQESIEFGVELMKHFGRRHIATLLSVLSEPAVETDRVATLNLTDRERSVYLRICDRGPISKVELRRSFFEMRAKERDQILARLMEAGLVEMKEGLVQSKAR